MKLEELMLELNREVLSENKNLHKIRGLCKKIRETVKKMPKKSKEFLEESNFLSNIREIEKRHGK